MSTREDLTETVVFMVHGLKRLSYGFHVLDELADSVTDGSPRKAFYLDGVYGYVAAFFLLDAKDRPPGGSFHRALDEHGLAALLNPVRSLFDARFGTTTFGSVLLTYRNNALVHSRHRDSDVDRIYESVDMESPQVRADFQARLEKLHELCLELAFDLADEAGIDPADLGLHR